MEVNLGAIRFNWKGAYAGATAYVADDVVSSGGASYICILASTGNATSNATYWSVMSSAGTNGTNGTDVGTTITTQGDLLFRDGSGLQRLAKGTTAQVLAMNAGATAPEWQAAAGGGMTLVSRVELNNTSTNLIQFTGMLTDTYDTYFFVGQVGSAIANNYTYALQFGNGGTNIATSPYYAGSAIRNYASSSAVTGTPSVQWGGRFDLTANNQIGVNRWLGFSGHLYHTRTTVDCATIVFQSGYSLYNVTGPSASDFLNVSGAGYYHGTGTQADSTKTFSDVSFHATNGNHQTGSWISLYGMNKS